MKYINYRMLGLSALFCTAVGAMAQTDGKGFTLWQRFHPVRKPADRHPLPRRRRSHRNRQVQ